MVQDVQDVDRDRARRPERDDHGGGTAALHRQHALSARPARQSAGHRQRRAGADAGRRRRAARRSGQESRRRAGRPRSAPRTGSSRPTSMSISATATSAATSPTRRRAVEASIQFPPGCYVMWSGQYEYLERATARLKIVVPVTLRDHLPAALSQLPLDHRNPDRDAVAAVRAGRRALADVVARLQPVGRGRRSASSRSPASPPRPAW